MKGADFVRMEELQGLAPPHTNSARIEYGAPSLETVFERPEDAERFRKEHSRRSSRAFFRRLVAYATASALLVVLAHAAFADDSAHSHTRGGDKLDTTMLETSFGDFICPGSPSTVHASCKAAVRAEASCADVAEEVLARVNGQFGTWHDPHNNGTYAVLQTVAGTRTLPLAGARTLQLSRRTGDDKYTDRISLTLEPAGEGACLVSGCSESQVFSIGDYGTNFCNIRNLLCGSKGEPACETVKHDFVTHMHHVLPSIGATVAPQKCNTV